MLRELHHAVLNDIKGSILIPNVIERAFESSIFGALEEVRQFVFGGH
jgi:hypothetical protein